MSNLALNKLPLEKDSWTRPEDATNGIVKGYTGTAGFAQSEYPCEFTIDLEKSAEIENIRFLLWDGLGKSNLVEEKNARKYRFSLSVSNDNIIYEIIFSNENDEGNNGWYSFDFNKRKTAKYIKLRGVSNTANKWFHIVEFEVHDDVPAELESKNVHEFDINEYGFKILPEKAELQDYTEDRTHEKLAGMLFNLINKEKEDKEDKTGITIGLEGGWGSGKSTVVNLFYKKIENVPEILYVYFDAWAHEGDSLRRIFLESFINDAQKKFQDCSEKLEEKKKKVTNREKHTETKTTRTGTKFGILLGLSSLLVPFGLAVVSGLVNQVTLKCTGEVNWIFIIGLSLSFAPFYIVLLKASIIWKKIGFKEIFNTKNWGFLHSNSSEDTTLETSEEEERSSIEFEKYFNEITDVIKGKHEKIKIVVVIDNLDRINAEDSLKIWSTLQTFLQRKNPVVNKKDNYDKIWIIVPYDEDGLKKLWKSKEKNITEKNGKDICPKSFFDKCFQLRLSVPPMITSGWQKFFSDKMDEVFIGWSEKEKKDALNVFRWISDGINSPSPREIKNFINQLGFLRANTGRDISCRALSYFVVKKHFESLTKKEILHGIFDEESKNKIPEKDLKPLLPKHIVNELIAILHGVSFEKGGELLLSKMIDEIVEDTNNIGLYKIQTSYGDTFWTVFDINITKMNDGSVEKYCHAIRPFWEEGVKRQKLERFSRRLKTIIKDKEIIYPEKDLLEKYASFFQIVEKSFFYIKNNTENDDSKEKELKEYKESFVKICEDFFMKFFEETKKPEFDIIYAGDVLIKLFQSIENKKDFSVKWNRISFDIWLKIIGENKSILEYVGTKNANIIIDETIAEQISTKISSKTPFDGILVELIDHCIKCGISKWDSVVDALNVHFRQPSGTNINSLNLFEKFVDSGKIQKVKLQGIISNPIFWTVAYNNKNNFPAYKLSLFAARLFDGDLSKINYSPVMGQPNLSSFLETEIKNLWRSSDEKIANSMWEEMKKLNEFSFLWNLAKDTSNKLTGKIIEKALVEKKKEVFDKFSFENNFKPAFLHLFSDIENELAQFFIENSEIEQELVKMPEIDLPKNGKEIYWLIKNSKNEELVQKVVGDIEKINKEQWVDIFEKDKYESSIVVELFNKERKISLEINYCDALIQMFNNLILSKKEPTAWQLENLEVLIKVMPLPFKSQFWNEVFETVKNVNFNIPDRFENIVISGICKKTYLSRDAITIQTAIKKAAVEKKLTILKFFHKLLETDKKNYFVPENDFGKVLDRPLNDIYEEIENPEYRKAIEFIAEKFNVELW